MLYLLQKSVLKFHFERCYTVLCAIGFDGVTVYRCEEIDCMMSTHTVMQTEYLL